MLPRWSQLFCTLLGLHPALQLQSRTQQANLTASTFGWQEGAVGTRSQGTWISALSAVWPWQATPLPMPQVPAWKGPGLAKSPQTLPQ